MIAVGWLLVLGSLVAVALAWCLPQRWSQDAVAAFTICLLGVISPFSAVWLFGVGVGVPLLMLVGDRLKLRGPLVIGGMLLMLVMLALSRFAEGGFLWIGGAYFTLRGLHVLFDWWMGRLTNPGFRRHLRYQLFIPVLMAGPINRIQLFERQLARKRWDPSDFFSGAERALFGLFSAVVVGTWLMSVVRSDLTPYLGLWPQFFRDWVLSAIDWGQLFFVFAGLSALALGLSLMMGLRLEENFDRPWLARDLLAFWTRWHMTLSSWARDYVFSPVTALTRRPVLGLIGAMLVIGLWHEFSIYYLLWGLWQVVGIVLTRLVRWSGWLGFTERWPPFVSAVTAPVLIFGWLSLARPALHGIWKGLGL